MLAAEDAGPSMQLATAKFDDVLPDFAFGEKYRQPHRFRLPVGICPPSTSTVGCSNFHRMKCTKQVMLVDTLRMGRAVAAVDTTRATQLPAPCLTCRQASKAGTLAGTTVCCMAVRRRTSTPTCRSVHGRISAEGHRERRGIQWGAKRQMRA